METAIPKDSNANILIVDDRPENLFSLEAILKQPELSIIKAGSGEEALRLILKHDIALILLDVQMPGMDGFETAELIRCNEETQYIPIIFVTAISKEDRHVFKGYDSGAVDYIFKPLDPLILKSKVSVFLDLHHKKEEVLRQNEELNAANQKILEQQNELIEEERLKVILQLAGAAANELSQPLMVLLGHIDLLEIDSAGSGKELKSLSQIKEAGQKLSQVVKKIQLVDEYQLIDHDSKTQVLKFDRKIKVLSIEDDDSSFKLIAAYLKDEKDILLKREKSIQSALKRVGKEKFDLILLDYDLPDGTGLGLMKMWQKQKNTCPVICLTGVGDEILAAKILKAGAYDYLVKTEIKRKDFLTSIMTAIEKSRMSQNLHSVFKKMAAMSTRDELTALYNRRYMNEVLEQEFNRAARYRTALSCILMDLDFFKRVNDTYGHDCGDIVLKEFAGILESNKRESDYAFRYGGEEFLMLLPQTDLDGAGAFAESIRRRCRKKTYVYQDNRINITVSIGIASIDSCRAKTGMDLITYADKALYRSKAGGRDCIRTFKKQEDPAVPEKLITGSKGIEYLKEQVSSILEKTKQASINSLELLVKEIGGEQLETETHRTREYVSFICNRLNLPYPVSQSIRQAASMNNCFKILLGEDILLKQEKLSHDDKILIKKLPYMQLEFVNLFDFFSNEKQVLLSNRERFDGQGYPEGLQSDEIPIGARILSITQAVAAMMSGRPYREKLDHESVILELVENAGTQFDPTLVEIFLDIVEKDNLLNVSNKFITSAKKMIHKAEEQKKTVK